MHLHRGFGDVRAGPEQVLQGIGVVRFEQRDVVRHPLVARIVGAYDQREAAQSEARRERERPQTSE